ncbi:hypothetical protein BJ508DRAFT_327573 [Ascobolus immersus RN42]|uniref:Uncharacterized protein n=1 Tax=Ascobolus immersus RN42 TaxID=1160509 RepID=A0A3N4I2C7_ASCIM|nr:hypothetical protein BJ508DRAFT_327573 [Ascobolus immersus RN42]
MAPTPLSGGKRKGKALERIKENNKKKKTHSVPEGEYRHGGGRGSKKYRVKKKLGLRGRNAHWCPMYTNDECKNIKSSRFVFKDNHIFWMVKAGQEYNWFGLSGHPLVGKDKLAFCKKILSEIGGCDGSSPNCQKIADTMVTKIQNLGVDIRDEGRLCKVIDPESPKGDYLPGVEILRSSRWRRDRDMDALLEKYDEGKDIGVLFKLLKKRLPDHAGIQALDAEIVGDVGRGKTEQDIMDYHIDIYPVSDDEVAGDEVDPEGEASDLEETLRRATGGNDEEGEDS